MFRRSRRELEIEQGLRVPAQIDEKRTAGFKLDFYVPLLQAGVLAIAFTGLAMSAVYTAKVAGGTTYWLGVLVWGTASFLWTVWRWLRQTAQSPSRSWLHGPLAALLTSLLAGLVSFSLWRIMGPIETASDAMRYMPILYFGFFAPFLFVAFFQELMYRSPGEIYLFQALANILEWKAKQPRSKGGVRHIYQYRGDPSGDADQLADAAFGLGATSREAVSRREAVQPYMVDMVEFLVRGQRLKVNGGPILYSRRKWRGLTLSSGTKVSEAMVKRWVKELAEAGILHRPDTGSPYDLAPGLSLRGALQHIGTEDG